MNCSIGLRRTCPHEHEWCGTNGRLCGNCGDEYMRGLEESTPKAKAFGGEDIGLVQKFKVEETLSVCGGGRACEALALDVDRLPCSDCGKKIGSCRIYSGF